MHSLSPRRHARRPRSRSRSPYRRNDDHRGNFRHGDYSRHPGARRDERHDFGSRSHSPRRHARRPRSRSRSLHRQKSRSRSRSRSPPRRRRDHSYSYYGDDEQPAAETAVALPDTFTTLPEDALCKVGRELVENDPRCLGFLCQTCTALLRIFNSYELKDAAAKNYRDQLDAPQWVGTMVAHQFFNNRLRQLPGNGRKCAPGAHLSMHSPSRANHIRAWQGSSASVG